MSLQYSLEFLKDDGVASDDAVYIQLRRNTPIYQGHITKEEYDVLDSGLKDDFITGVFNIGGVVEFSSKAYRLWVMKSPTFTWEEVLAPLLTYLQEFYEEDEYEPMPGSANIDGSGRRLTDYKNRRDI